MAITKDASSTGHADAGNTTLDFSHTCTGSNLLLLVHIQIEQDLVTGVTYNSVAMTQLKKEIGAGSVGAVYIYGLLAPTTGANTISIAFTGVNKYITGIGESYAGVVQSNLPDATASSFDNTGVSALATTITTVADNCWVGGIAFWTTALTSVTNGTIRTNGSPTSSNITSFDTNGVVTPAGNKTLTANGTTVKVNTLVSFAPFVASATKTLAALGVG